MLPSIIAHRGAQQRFPENTVPAFLDAIAQGADGIELDVHLSADGALMVHHDEQLGRVFSGQGLLGSYTAAQLRQQTAGIPGLHMPTLEEVLTAIQPWAHNLLINIELKTDAIVYAGIEDKVAALLGSFGPGDRILVSSFNHYTMRTWRDRYPQVKMGLLYQEHLIDPWLYGANLGATSLHPWYPAVTPGMVQHAHALGLQVLVWTVNDRADLLRTIQCGVDGIITDDVPLARQVLEDLYRFGG